MAMYQNKEVEEDSASSSQVVEIKEDSKPEEEGVKTKLHFPTDWDILPKEKYIYQFHHQKLPKIHVGQASIYAIKFLEVNEEILVEAFIQNATEQALKFEEVDLVVVDEKGELAAKKTFSFELLEEFPPLSCTPWRFIFLKEDRVSVKTPSNEWKILFQVKTERLDLEKSWEESLTPEQKENFKRMLEKLPKMGKDEVNFTGIHVRFLENQSLEVMVFVRNGTSQGMQLEKLPLTLVDASGDVVCKGQFELPPLTVNPHTAKPWAFIFPLELIQKEQPDFSRWRIEVQNNNE
ncbi:MAG: accessory Sec system S-layer assembly protein [Bacillota bacterium]|nr:accessory Sec system S-layer assembly protein [Bacillota bacterium]